MSEIICECGHEYNDHTDFGGCLLHDCDCENSQVDICKKFMDERDTLRKQLDRISHNQDMAIGENEILQAKLDIAVEALDICRTTIVTTDGIDWKKMCGIHVDAATSVLAEIKRIGEEK